MNSALTLPAPLSMADLIRNTDWSGTPLGPESHWPESLKLMHQLMMSSRLPMAVAWGPAQTLLYNDAYARLLAHRHPGALGLPIMDVWHEAGAQLAPVMACLTRLTPEDAPVSRTLVQDIHSSIDECFFHTYVPVMSGEGMVSGLFCICTPIQLCERREQNEGRSNPPAEARTQSRESPSEAIGSKLTSDDTLIKTIYRHSSEGHAILIERADGRFEYEEINPAMLTLYARTRTQVIGQTLESVIGPAQAVAVSLHLRECLQDGLPRQYERRQGKRVLAATASAVAERRAGPRRVVVSARDVTESRRLDDILRQAQKVEAVGQLTGGVAQDFNNLLGSIIAALEVMQSRIDQGRVSELGRYVTSAYGAASRAAELTHRLLAYSRQQTLSSQTIDLGRLVCDNEAVIKHTCGAAVSVEIQNETASCTVMADSHQLERSLLNLCINARDAMPDGGALKIRIANLLLDQQSADDLNLAPGEYSSLCVTDTGTGMTPQVAARAFDPFFSTKPKFPGTGLGLSMVQGFARQSGGGACIRPGTGLGTTVCIYLPRHLGPAEEKPTPHDKRSAQDAPLGKSVLFVDDEAPLRMLAIEVLEESGYTVLEAVDGVSALSILESNRSIDLLVTDVSLPGGINGRQLADAGRALRPGLRVLFITGFAAEAVLCQGRLGGGFHVLTKPFSMETLMGLAGDIMGGPPRLDAAMSPQ